MRLIIDDRMLDKNCFTHICSRYITDLLWTLQKDKPQVEFCHFTDSFSRREISADDILLRIGGTQSGRIKKWPVPQLVWLPGIEKRDFSKKRYFLKFRKKLPDIFKYADCVLVDSEKSKKNLLGQTHQNAGIAVVSHVGDEGCHPASIEEKEQSKMHYAKGKDYFLIIQTGSEVFDFIELLKAFSQFKKKQLSNMQLVIVGRLSEIESKFSEKLDSFKYRDEVHIYNNPNEAELKQIISSAYMLLQPVADPDMMLNAFRMNVPVLIDEKDYSEEAVSAVVTAPFASYDQLARQLILLYTNEYFRNELIENAGARAALSSRENQVKQIWDAIQGVMKR